MDIDVAAMRRRLDAATPGPWSHHGADVRGPGAVIFTGRDGSAQLRGQADRDAEFVANAREDFAALLDLIQDRLQPVNPPPVEPVGRADARQAPAKHRKSS
jgi:hypothetical protein